MTLKLTDTLRLSSGERIPQLGLGIYKSSKDVCKATIAAALGAGYRHIDSAQYYENEAEMGEAVRESSLDRKDIFVTTKTFGNGETTEEMLIDLKESVKRIGLQYVDLFLIHGPAAGPHSPSTGPERRKILWKALEALQKEGLAKSIGVSNFGVEHLKQLKESATIKPVLNQIELHPWCQQRDIVEECRAQGILVQAYCPIIRNKKADDPVLLKIAKKHDKQTTQVLIRWSLQKGYIPLPKSDNPDRIKANADVYHFNLDDQDMQELDSLDVHFTCAPDNTRCP